jgi:hypothetical protein
MHPRPRFDQALSRRSFLGAAVGGLAFAGLGLGGGDEALRMGRGALAIQRAWRVASLDNGAFLAEKASVFRNVVLGCSFAPEQWNEAERANGGALAALRFAVEDLGIDQVRLGIRWDHVAREDGSVDLSFYRPYLDYLFEKVARVCLNVGPIRTFRWPEDHVPGFVLSRVSLPANGARVEPGTPLAGEALTYLDRLLDNLLSEYGEDVRNLAAVQPENEPFWPFGAHDWRMSSAYLRQVVLEIDRCLPSVPILLTSAGRLNLDTITGFFQEMVANEERFRGRFVSGFDYHYKTPRIMAYPLVHHLDPIAFAFRFPPAKTCEANIRDSRDAGFAIEVSEGEAEPTGKITSPGNSARDFRFMLLRCAEEVLDREKPSVLRIWGIEHLAKKALGGEAGPEHLQMVDLIRRLA